MAQDDYSAIIASVLGGKSGADFSSNTMDPVMQYLLGNFQSAPKFTLDQMYQRNAPTHTSVSPTNIAQKRASDAIKNGASVYDLMTDKVLQKQSMMPPEIWSKFLQNLADENQAVNKAMIDQSNEQDVFQKAGMPGANESYLDTNPDGGLKNIATAYKYAPQEFTNILANLPAQQAARTKSDQDIKSRYGDVMLTSDAEKKAKLLADAMMSEQSIVRNNKGGGRSQSWKLPTSVAARGQQRANNEFDKVGKLPMRDEAATARNLSYANYITSLRDRTVGSAADTERRARETALQILTQLSNAGATPLKDSLLSNAMLKRSTKNG